MGGRAIFEGLREFATPPPKEPKPMQHATALFGCLTAAMVAIAVFLGVVVLDRISTLTAQVQDQESKINDLTSKLYFVKPGGVDRLARRAEINEKRLDVLVKRLGGQPTVIEADYKDKLNEGLPGEDEWPMTPEEFEELQRKLREQMEQEKKS